ncbi:MAG: hypothetical protein S4CHLAM20_07550 [Chlamydiia bacterium]|nr:hypothetical protein [Chlamydiia bacterium]
MAGNIPIMSDQKFALVVGFFADTKYNKVFQKLELIAVEGRFSNVVTLVIDSAFRYFQVPAKFIQAVAPTNFQGLVLTAPERKLLHKIKQQLNCVQVHLDLPRNAINRVASVINNYPNVLNYFEVPAVRDGYIRFALNFNSDNRKL